MKFMKHMAEHPAVYVSELTLCNRQKIQIKRDSIVVFVGANNVGKSQTLRDVYALLNDMKERQGLVVDKVKLHLPDFLAAIGEDDAEEDRIDLGAYLQAAFEPYYDRKASCYYFPGDPRPYRTLDKAISINGLGFLRNFFCSYVGTADRLNAVNPLDNLNETDDVKEPYHALIYDRTLFNRFSDAFERVFRLKPHLSCKRVKCTTIRLLPGTENLRKVSEDSQAVEDMVESVQDAIASYPALHEQGDGMRSFAGLLMNVLDEHKRLFLLDEPEAFLHPPQAQEAGQILSSVIRKDQQAFIATHSDDLLKGLLAAAPDRLVVVRLTRTEKETKASIVVNSELQELLKDSFFRYTNVLSSLFYPITILCESDSDCRLYAAVQAYLNRTKGAVAENLFLGCGGKQRSCKIVPALRKLGIDFRVVLDLDLLDDAKNVKNIVEAAGGTWADYKTDVEKLINEIAKCRSQAMVVRPTQEEFLQKVTSRFAAGGKTIMSDLDCRKVRKMMAGENIWDALKQKGISACPTNELKRLFKSLLTHLSELGIVVPSTGELESLVSGDANKHGPQWALEVLGKTPDLSNAKYKQVREFVNSWNAGAIASH